MDNTCQVPACPAVQRLYSDYCPAHACARSGCGAPRGAESTACDEHTCTVMLHDSRRCDQLRTAADNDSEPDFPFCHYHICRNPSCPNEAAAYDGFCQLHECQWEGSHGPACPGMAIEGSRYCSEHVCGYNACFAARAVITENGATLLVEACLSHLCRWRTRRPPRCPDAWRLLPEGTTSRYCAAHGCAEENCSRYRRLRSAGGKLCEDHGCAFGGNGGCSETRDSRSRYCAQHRCRRCSREREHPFDFCKRHEFNCEWVGCTLTTNRRRRHRNAYCRDHECLWASCRDARCDDLESDFCSAHRCKRREWYSGQPRCAGGRVDAKYCVAHRACSIGVCDHFEYWTTDYCERHRYCTVCGEKRTAGSGFQERYTCPRHYCSREGCWSLKMESGTLCGPHQADQQEQDRQRLALVEQRPNQEADLARAAVRSRRDFREGWLVGAIDSADVLTDHAAGRDILRTLLQRYDHRVAEHGNQAAVNQIATLTEGLNVSDVPTVPEALHRARQRLMTSQGRLAGHGHGGEAGRITDVIENDTEPPTTSQSTPVTPATDVG